MLVCEGGDGVLKCSVKRRKALDQAGEADLRLDWHLDCTKLTSAKYRFTAAL